MSNSDSPAAGTAESNQTGTLSRRRILRGTASTGALLLGAGVASANGKGGQAFVDTDVYDADATFEISPVDDCPGQSTPYCRQYDIFFQCEGRGRSLPFPYWGAKYVGDEGDSFRLYTRDNSIDTDATYRWSRKKKECPEIEDPDGGEYYQVGFVVDD